jgi:hypothetical protein
VLLISERSRGSILWARVAFYSKLDVACYSGYLGTSWGRNEYIVSREDKKTKNSIEF